MNKTGNWKEHFNVDKDLEVKNIRSYFKCSKCGSKTKAPQKTKRLENKLCKNCFGKKRDNRKNQLNELTGSQWATLSKSVMEYSGTRPEKQKIHGAAFPLSFVEHHISTYSKRGETIFDPFLGVGTVSEAAEKLGRKSIGIELNPEFVKLAKKDIKNLKNHKIICDDVRNSKKHIKDNSVDLIITSPPYATLLRTIKGNFAYKWREHSDLNVIKNPPPYSSEKKDFGNLTYEEFMDEITGVFKDNYEILKDNCYSVWVVKDYRDLKNKVPYVNFHSDIIKAAQLSGFLLWDIRIYDQTKYRPLVVLGYPSRNYYLNMGHSYILIFKKHIVSKLKRKKT
jgi:DNA modification methylase|tara:strand:- start:5493 stop:6506 length:1014 start_codon:yes stop_codon:yes gene_type:complete